MSNNLIYRLKMTSEISNGKGDPIRVPASDTFEAESALELVEKGQKVLTLHQGEMADFLQLKTGWYVWSSIR